MAKRLIDANAADVERIYCTYGSHCTLEDVQQWLDEQRTVDAVEVVRCKDCERISPSVTARKNEVWCRKIRAYVPVDGFCSYGERRNDE